MLNKDLLTSLTKIQPAVIDMYTQLWGLDCDIYLPKSVTTRLYDDSSKVEYNKIPSMKGKYLFINYMPNDALRGNLVQFDSFLNDNRPQILTYESKRIPRRARIDAYLGEAVITFTTDVDLTISGIKLPDNPDPFLCVKQVLRPLN